MRETKLEYEARKKMRRTKQEKRSKKYKARKQNKEECTNDKNI